jgi:hypothetical protein
LPNGTPQCQMLHVAPQMHRSEPELMPKRNPSESKSPRQSFRARYDALEQRREDLIARLGDLGEKAQANPAHARARKLLNETFRGASLVQRAAVLEAASWLITVLDRSMTLL